jgi:hypothetical protein
MGRNQNPRWSYCNGNLKQQIKCHILPPAKKGTEKKRERDRRGERDMRDSTSYADPGLKMWDTFALATVLTLKFYPEHPLFKGAAQSVQSQVSIRYDLENWV